MLTKEEYESMTEEEVSDYINYGKLPDRLIK